MAVDLDAIRKRVKELQNGRKNSNVQLWKPKEPGEYVVRGLPWPSNVVQDCQPFIEKWFYYIGDNFGVLTPSQFGKPDPIKEFIDSLYASGKPEDREIAKKLKPKMQVYLPIVVKKGKDADTNKVIVWSINKFLYQKMLAWFLDEDVGDYLDPEGGFDIKVTFTDNGKKFNGRTVLNSDVELARKPTKLAPTGEEMKKLLEAIPNIEDMNELKSYQELEKMLQKWLDGASSGSDSEGTERGASSGDALEELANEIKTEARVESPKTEDAKSEVKAAKKKLKKDDSDDDSDEPKVQKQTLDQAFEELMSSEDD